MGVGDIVTISDSMIGSTMCQLADGVGGDTTIVPENLLLPDWLSCWQQVKTKLLQTHLV